MNRTYLRLKGCPKCGGDILIDKVLEDGAVCIQCGFRNLKITDKPANPRKLIGTEELKVKSKSKPKRVQV